MGITHLSGLEVKGPFKAQSMSIGHEDVGIWSTSAQVQKVRFTALDAAKQLHFPEGALITELRVMTDAGALAIATISIGTTLHGAEIFVGASSAGEPAAAIVLPVNKTAPAGLVYIEADAGTPPLNVYVTYIPVVT